MFLIDIISNPVLIVPASAWLIAQVLKLLINAVVNKKFSMSRLVGDGGMPSAHSATVTSLAVMTGLLDTDGFAGAPFAVAMILAVVVMHDALGVRRETGKQAVSIIKMAELLNDYLTEHDQKIKTDKLKVLVGHTPLQVVCGSILGAVVSIAAYFIFAL